MKDRLIRIAKWVAYPLFYVLCLLIFGYLTFPYNRLKDRVIAEFERRGKPGQRLEIEKISSYWLSGVEVAGAKVTLPADDGVPPGLPNPSGDSSQGALKSSSISVEEGHARIRLLPLLIGRVRLDFWAKALGGEVTGSAPLGGSGGDVTLELENIDIGKIDPIVQAVGLPMKGMATGKLELSPTDGKFNKATGSLELSVADIVVSDGKTKIQGLIELPAAKAGTLTISAEAKEGVLKITKLTSTGADIELIGDGRITMKEPWNDSVVDVYLRFKFTDAYRTKNETTKLLLGEPGASTPGLMESQVPKMKRSKRADGFYGWHVHGPLKKLKFDPSSTDAPAAGTTPGKARKGGELKKPPSVAFPFGTSQAKPPETKLPDEEPPPQRTPPPMPAAPVVAVPSPPPEPPPPPPQLVDPPPPPEPPPTEHVEQPVPQLEDTPAVPHGDEVVPQ